MMSFIGFRTKLNKLLKRKLKQFKLIGEGNVKNSTLSLKTQALFIECHVLIPISKMGP
jgi:hypothetical protein